MRDAVKQKPARIRKVNLQKLSQDQAELIGVELGKKISEIGDEAAQRINQICEIYGLKAKIAVQLTDGKTGQIL